MSSSPSDAEKYAQRAKVREARVQEEKKIAEEVIQQGYSAMREQHEVEIEKARNESRILAEKKKDELTKVRAEQTKELAQLEAKLEAATKEKISMRAEEGKLEVEKRREELERKQKELEYQINLRRDHLNASSEILKNGEKLRQECLNRLRVDRKKELEEMNQKTLELNQKLHETRIDGEERLQQLDEKRNEEQKTQLLKKERVILSGISQSAALSSSLSLEDSFELFKQQCKALRDKHRIFCFAFDEIQPQLLKTHKRMQSAQKLRDSCAMEDLLSALRVFHERATTFTSEGSTAENNFQEKIGKVIEIIRQLRTDINNIKSKIEDYEEDEMENPGDGIGEEMVNIDNRMKDMGELIQEFNVIGTNHLQETLAIQMEQAQSSRRHNAIEGGPPAYDSTKKVKPAAITEN